MDEFFINGIDSRLYGVHAGDGFMSAIDGLASLKSFIENSSRLQNGKRIIVNSPRVSSREVTLKFVLIGENQYDFRCKRNAFEKLLNQGKIEIKIPRLNNSIYRLVYSGTSITYALNRRRTSCQISAKFTEPNPKNRGEEDNEDA